MKEVLRRCLACVGRGDPIPIRTRLVRGMVNELVRAEWALHALPNTEEQSLRDEMWRCPIWECQGLSLNDRNNVRQQNFIAILLPRHHAIDNTKRTSSTVTDCSPYHDTAYFVTVMLLQAAWFKSLASKAMNVDSTIAEVECKPRFVAPHYSMPFIQPFLRLISAPSLSQIRVPWSQWDPHCWASPPHVFHLQLSVGKLCVRCS